MKKFFLFENDSFQTGDAILYAIEEENVEAVEILISYLEKIDKFNPEVKKEGDLREKERGWKGLKMSGSSVN